MQRDVRMALNTSKTQCFRYFEELEKLAKETEFAAGYVRVRTPHLAKEKMYKTSGHLPYYAEPGRVGSCDDGSCGSSRRTGSRS